MDSWRPEPTDVMWEEISQHLRDEPFSVPAVGYKGYVYEYKGLAYKMNCRQREYDIMKKVGNDCAVQAVARVINSTFDGGRPKMIGILMELHTPFDIKAVEKSERAAIKDEMIRIVTTLHEKYGVVHGDIKPTNMLRRSDGTICLCDFGSARPIGEDPPVWDGLSEWRYLAPNRDDYGKGSAPTPSDDLYALGLCIWELYTGKDALMDNGGGVENIDQVLKEKRTVDVMEVEEGDEAVRDVIRGFLRQGGALV